MRSARVASSRATTRGSGDKKIPTQFVGFYVSPRAVPIAPVDQMLAAVAVPNTHCLSLRMALPPMKPSPVMLPYRTRASTSVESSTEMPYSVKPQDATATRRKMRRPALPVICSRFQAMGRANT